MIGIVTRRRAGRIAVGRPAQGMKGMVAWLGWIGAIVGLTAGITACATLSGVGVTVAAERPHVYIVLIDGLDSRRLSETLTPTLWKLGTGPGGRGAFYREGRAVMPTVTNTNHVSIMTGAYAEAHGVVNNAFWAEAVPRRGMTSERADLLQVETLFTVAERTRPKLVTAALFGKTRLVPLFTASASQRAPDILWGDPDTPTEPIDRNRGFASDRRTMDKALEVIATSDPDLLFVGLPDVDRTSHVFGPDSHRARTAMLEADRQVDRLIRALKRSGAWEDTVLMITADHGFADVSPDAAAGRPYPMITLGSVMEAQGLAGVGLLGIGGLESVVIVGATPDALTSDQHRTLAEVRRHALEHSGVQAAWYRNDNPHDGGAEHTIRRARPSWRIDHPRTGALVLVGRPGYHFVDPFRPWAASFLGMHGGPDAQTVPILVTGGHPRLRAERVIPGEGTPPAANPDLGTTTAWLLDLREPRALTGKRVPERSRGRILREAFRD